MQKVRVNVVLLDQQGVIVPSFEGTQFTGVKNDEFIYARCVFGAAPTFVKIPVADAREASEEYSSLPDFQTKEFSIQEQNYSKDYFAKYGIDTLEEAMLNTINNAVSAEEKFYMA